MRARGNRMGLLADVVVQQFESVPTDSLNQEHLDTLLITERLLGPLAAAIHAGRYVVLASDSALLAESDRLDAAEAALDDKVSVDDPRVAEIASERYAFERALHSAIDNSDQSARSAALFDTSEAAADRDSDTGEGREDRRVSAFEALGRMPHD